MDTGTFVVYPDFEAHVWIFTDCCGTKMTDASFDNLLSRATFGYGRSDLRDQQIRDAFAYAAKTNNFQ